MPWVVGIDEAGYGPNLGPLVQTAVSIMLPETDPAGWNTTRTCLRRAAESDDSRLCVDDSKKIYAKPGGLARLERGVFSALALNPGSITSLLSVLAEAAVLTELQQEIWFDGTETVPLHCEQLPSVHYADGVRIGPCSANLVPASLFNKIVAGSGSKGTVLAAGLIGLLGTIIKNLPPEESVLVLCDKQGGRHYYAPVLQAAFPDGWIVTEGETPAESRYRVENLQRTITIIFRPRADADGVAVALASMLAKYLREVCMRQFNRFWRTHLPDLQPTAGYPGDAKRYFLAIQPIMEKLGLAVETVWRIK